MKKKLAKKMTIAILAIILTCIPNYIKSQVTIGSNISPLKGVILDLKQKDSSKGESNSERGLGLPRVVLTSTSNLYPMFEADEPAYSGENKALQNMAHVGLLVYNTNTVAEENLKPGLHVWNGSQWKGLNFNQAEPPIVPGEDYSGTQFEGTVEGISGTIYPTFQFGDAGEWIVENLRETEYDTDLIQYLKDMGRYNDTEFLLEEGVITSKDMQQYRFYTYPNDDKGLYTKHPEYGLLYSIYTASAGMVADQTMKNIYDYEAQTELIDGKNSRTSTVQGICPNGWVLPSDYDWAQLRAEIMTNPAKYSSVGNDQGSYIVGQAAKSKTMVEGASGETNGLSKKYAFNALLVGKYDGYFHSYGTLASFWTSSAITTYNSNYVEEPIEASSRILHRDVSNTNKAGSDIFQGMNSVRCKKK